MTALEDKIFQNMWLMELQIYNCGRFIRVNSFFHHNGDHICDFQQLQSKETSENSSVLETQTLLNCAFSAEGELCRKTCFSTFQSKIHIFFFAHAFFKFTAKLKAYQEMTQIKTTLTVTYLIHCTGCLQSDKQLLSLCCLSYTIWNKWSEIKSAW